MFEPSSEKRCGAWCIAAFACVASVAAAPANAQDGAPGTIVADPEAAERALERSLVRSGQLLLPPGAIEVAPSLSFEYSERDQVLFFNDNQGNTVTDIFTTERSTVTAAIDARFGLPGDSQFEVRLPLNYVDQSIEQGLLALPGDGDAQGVGNPVFAFAKTLARESGGFPDLVGRIAWDTDWGDNGDGPVSLSSDFNELRGSLSALWRLDPVALTAGVVYEYTFENNGVQPGGLIGFNVGTSLAASPTTSLGVNFNASFRDDSELNGVTIEDSSENQASIGFVIATLVGRNALLQINFGAGLTEDSPDYFFGVSLPVRW